MHSLGVFIVIKSWMNTVKYHWYLWTGRSMWRVGLVLGPSFDLLGHWNLTARFTEERTKWVFRFRYLPCFVPPGFLIDFWSQMGKGCAGAGRFGSTRALSADMTAIRYCQEVKNRVLISLYFRHSHSTGPAQARQDKWKEWREKKTISSNLK